LFDEDELGDAREHGFDVRVGIALGVTIRTGHGDEAVEGTFGVGGYVGISVFIDEYASGGVWHVEEAGTNTDAKGGDDALDIFGDIDHLGAA